MPESVTTYPINMTVFVQLSKIKVIYLSALITDEKYRPIKEKLLNNLRYSNTAVGDHPFLLFLPFQNRYIYTEI